MHHDYKEDRADTIQALMILEGLNHPMIERAKIRLQEDLWRILYCMSEDEGDY